ncbi:MULTISPECIES: translation factor GTPase family protein [unclassified Nocardia]|uniref:elongation factor G n=1 Tax=unclassified Nocardia TaxID=2637762 RepID=UPI001CE45F68|nr:MULTISPECIES: TetM/TetW/TetO/TetS family tetracycline resistance ribosomal protection protein [unclassified Nocardia]
MRTLNIGVMAHVDAGKTSLTERLLFDTGAITALGSVDAGTTQTDTGTIERQRGITVRSAVTSFRLGETQVNVIDTPGHTDFVAEVDRALELLDAAVLVISAVEGVQAHTRVLFRVLREMGLPVLIFVNKIDRAGARVTGLLDDIRTGLTRHVLPLTTVRESGTAHVRVRSKSPDDTVFQLEVAETLAELDDSLLSRLVDGPPPTAAELGAATAEFTARGAVYPVYFGSALHGIGIRELLHGIETLLLPRPNDPAAAPEGVVFAIDRTASGAKIAYLRLFSGTVTARQRMTLRRAAPDGGEYAGRITSLRVVGGGTRLTAGNIGKITGWPQVRVGDRLASNGERGRPVAHLAEPTLRTVVRPRTGTPSRLHLALRQLSEQDPLLHIRTEADGTTSVLLYGEIQKQIIAATLAAEFGIAAEFELSEPVHIERVTGVGAAAEVMDRHTPRPCGFWATVGLRVEPAEGIRFDYETELGALPRAFHTAIEETVHAILRAGPHGRTVTDCLVTLTHSGFAPPVSTAADFRGLTRIVLLRALDLAGTRILEPHHAFETEIPSDTLASVTAHLTTLAAAITETTQPTSATWLVRGTLPARNVHAAQQFLPTLTRGEATWLSRPAAYKPLP